MYVLIAELLIKFGVFFVSYEGLRMAIETLLSYATSAGIPDEAIQLLGLAQVDVALNILLSAAVARMAFNMAGKSLRFGGAS